MQPATINERFDVLDALRGFALFGILLANLYSFFGYNTLTSEEIISLPIADRGVLFFLTWATSDLAFWGSLSRYSAQLKVELGFGDLSLLDMRTSDSAREVFFVNALGAIPRPMSYPLSGRYMQVFGMFLIGLVLSRRLPGLVTNRIPLSPMMTVAFLIGLSCSLTYAWTKAATGSYYSLTPMGAVQAVVLHIGAPPLSLAIGWVFLTLWQRAPDSAVFRHLATLGRMALTNYLFQTSVSVLLFFGYGLGLMGKLPYSVLPLFGFGILISQWILSDYWLRSHAQGPLESIWKRLAYVKQRKPLPTR